jgi:chemotaxis-related protein WspD
MDELQTCWKKIGVWGDHSCAKLVQHIHCRNCEVFGSAAAKLLNRPLPPSYREEWTARIAQPRASKKANGKSIVIFRIGTEWLALPTSVFIEVSEPRPIHSLPHRESALVRGVVNIRGELLICISLGGFLGLDENPPSKREARERRVIYERLVVIGKKGGDRVAFEVSEVHVGHRYREEEVNPVPATVSLATTPHPSYTRGLLPWNGENVGIIDEELLFYSLNRSLA